MELSPARQKLLFMVIVVVLAALGYSLLLPAIHHKNSAVPSPPAAASSSAQPADPVTPAVTVAPVDTRSPASGPVNIYNWLPFTEQNLATAAKVTTRFCVDYDSYTYTESAAAYIGKMNGLINAELAATLQDGYQAPGVSGLRTGQKQISSATATVTSLRAFGQQSLTFVVTISQHLVSSKGTSDSSPAFAVTVTGSGNSWQVSDIEPAQAGNT